MAERHEPHGSDWTDRPEADLWSREDDDLVRAALMTLRDDVDAEPLPEPAWVRAQARQASRRRTAAWAAGIAAAAIAVAAVGFAAAGRDAAMDKPLPGQSTTAEPPSPSPTTAAQVVLSDVRSALPVATEWQAVLGLDEAPSVEEVTGGDSVRGACNLEIGDASVAGFERVTRPGGNDQTVSLLATQAWLAYPSTTEAAAASRRLGQQAEGCGTPTEVAAAGRDVAIFEIAAPDVPESSIEQLLDVATERLTRYGSPPAMQTSTSSSAATPAPSTETSSRSTPSSGPAAECGARSLGLDTTGVNAPQAEKAKVVLEALLACDRKRLVTLASDDSTEVSFGGLTPEQAFALPAEKERYQKGAILLSLKPEVVEGYARWPAEPKTEDEWDTLVAAGLLTESDKDMLRAGGTGYTGWRIVIDDSGTMTAFIAGD